MELDGEEVTTTLQKDEETVKMCVRVASGMYTR